MEKDLQPRTPSRKRGRDPMENECSANKVEQLTDLQVFKKASKMSWSEVMAVPDVELRRRLQVRKDHTEAFLFWQDPVK